MILFLPHNIESITKRRVVIDGASRYIKASDKYSLGTSEIKFVWELNNRHKVILYHLDMPGSPETTCVEIDAKNQIIAKEYQYARQYTLMHDNFQRKTLSGWIDETLKETEFNEKPDTVPDTIRDEDGKEYELAFLDQSGVPYYRPKNSVI